MMQNTLKLQENLGNEFFNFSFLWQVAGGGGAWMFVLALLYYEIASL